MLNYSTKAIEDMQAVLDRSRKPSHIPLSHKAMSEIIRLLDLAVKIELPDNAALVEPEKAVSLIETDLLRLPFPLVALEYPYSDCSRLSGDKVVVPKRIALCIEYESFKQSFFGQIASDTYPAIKECGGIILIPIFYFSDAFMPSIWGMLIPRKPFSSELSHLTFAGERDESSMLGFTAFPILPEGAVASVQELGLDQAKDTGLADCVEELLALVELLVALSCSNISLKDNLAPEKLNKKRLKSGKTPFYDTKTITINIDKVRSLRSHREGAESGRKSPLTHLRRGHIRNWQGKRIWVQASIVGAGREAKQLYQVVRGVTNVAAKKVSTSH